jgi:hypothetical protein
MVKILCVMATREERGSMFETISNAIGAVAAKPAVALGAGIGSVVTWILTIIGILSPIIAFATLILGFMAAYHSYRKNKREDKG